jgi:tRNA (guanine-N7-)-methyltransferase
VTDSSVADSLAAVLRVGGDFELVTDEGWYAEETREVLDGHEALSAGPCEANPARARTKYERRWLEMGKGIVRLLVTKTGPFTAERKTWGLYEARERGEEMHVRTGEPLPEWRKWPLAGAGSRGDAHWAFKKCYAGEERTFLVETLASDGGFEQRYYLKVVGRDGDALVKLDGTPVYLTPAVRLSVEDLGRRLAGDARGVSA